MTEINLVESTKICDICGIFEDNPVVLGEFISKGKLNVHYFCVLLSTNIVQRGEDSHGIYGFLHKDIKKEVKNASERDCSYCFLKGASIKCNICEVYFHVKCGYDFGCVTEFTGSFPSYCDKHHKLKLKKTKNINRLPCCICQYSMGSCDLTKYISASCCGNGYVHIFCMRKYALAAGYYLRCIWCKNTEFRETIKLKSVYVPDREALWEQDKKIFADLHKGHSQCDATICNCPKGRKFTNKKWQIIICNLCGSFGIHNSDCIPNKNGIKVDSFQCDVCCEIFKQNELKKGIKKSTPSLSFNLCEIEKINKNESIANKVEGINHNTQINNNLNKDNICLPQENSENFASVSNIAFKKLIILNHDSSRQIGGGVAKIDFNDPRFKGRSIEKIKASELKSEDIIKINNETILNDLADKIAKEFIESQQVIEIVSSEEELDTSDQEILNLI